MINFKKFRNKIMATLSNGLDLDPARTVQIRIPDQDPQHWLQVLCFFI